MEKVWLEDYTVGERLVSPGRTITETDIVLFSAFTGDWHPLHTDVEYAKKSFFKERIAHGMLGLVVGSALMFRLGPHVLLPKSFIAFHGMDRVRFTGPVKIGDTIRCEAVVAELQERDERMGLLRYEATIKNQRDESCLVFHTSFYAGRRRA
jgi:acyl dehydratase